MTLVDTSCLEIARHKRLWQEAYRLIPNTKMYEGIAQVLEFIKQKQLKMAIVSNSPHIYVEKLVNYYGIPTNWIVGYHDAHPNKPHPAPMLKALEYMKEDTCRVISFGDRVIDIRSSEAAGIKAVGCLWGTQEAKQLLMLPCYRILKKPQDIIQLLDNNF